MQTALAESGLLPVLGIAFPETLSSPRPVGEPRSAARRTYEADGEVFAEGDRAAFFYEVVSGSARTYKLLADGRRQINAFHLPGDIFGFEAGGEHRFSAEAVADTKLVVHSRERGALAGNDGSLAREVVAAMMRSLERAQDHMMVLGRKSAKERIATFLLGLAERLAEQGGPLDLPMPRADIADHLGLTVESVSRAVTQLEREGLIELPPNRRTIVLRNTAALRNMTA